MFINENKNPENLLNPEENVTKIILRDSLNNHVEFDFSNQNQLNVIKKKKENRLIFFRSILEDHHLSKALVRLLLKLSAKISNHAPLLRKIAMDIHGQCEDVSEDVS